MKTRNIDLGRMRAGIDASAPLTTGASAMATFNLMLIPTFLPTDKPSITGAWYQGVVKDQNDNILWRSPIERFWAHEAQRDAELHASKRSDCLRIRLPPEVVP